MRQKDDQPFTELLIRFRTASQIEGEIQCIQSWLVHPEDTDYPVSIVLYFWDSFSCISCLFFIFLNCFSPRIFFSLLAPLLYSIVFFLCLIINFFFPFYQLLYMNMYQTVFCIALEYYISLVFF